MWEYALELNQWLKKWATRLWVSRSIRGDSCLKTMDAAPQLVIVNVALNDGKKGWDFYNDIKHLGDSMLVYFLKLQPTSMKKF